MDALLRSCNFNYQEVLDFAKIFSVKMLIQELFQTGDALKIISSNYYIILIEKK